MRIYILFMLLIFTMSGAKAQIVNHNIGLVQSYGSISGKIDQKSKVNITFEVNQKAEYAILFEYYYSADDDVSYRINNIELKDIPNNRRVSSPYGDDIDLWPDLFYISYVLDPGTYTFSLDMDVDYQVDYSFTLQYQAASSSSMITKPLPSTPTTNRNYVLSRTYTSSDGKSFLDGIQYFDGLGRPIQTVQRGITPDALDLVSIQEYDAFGRESNTWLSGKVTTVNNGAFVAIETAKGYAKASNGSDQKPYSMPVYEASPLNRVLKQYGPGQDWQNNGKAVTTGYLTNTYKASASLTVADSLVCARYVADDTRGSIIVSRSGNYAAGELYVTRLKDENGNTSYEFKDKLGKVILTRQVNVNEHGITELLDTYYAFDSYGNLKMVLPPMASDMVNTDAAQLNANSYVRLNLAYLYFYDNRNRCIGKKLPGCDWTYYVYDKADRLIFTQDGEQRKTDEWTFNKYDVFGRILMTGLHTMAGKTHDQLRAIVENQLVTEKYLLNSHWSYTWNSLANLLTSSNYKQVLQVNYYDNYEFRKRPEYVVSKFNFTNAGTEYNKRYGTDAGLIEQKGQLTGTATARLDGQNKFDYSVLYYDDRKQVIQTKSTNHLDGIEEEYIAYNFTGQPTQRKHVHSATGKNTQTEVYTYNYDHAGRLLSTKHKWNTGAEVTLAENSYDELGRLKTNKKGGRTELNTAYTYNVRSWTKSIVSPLFNQELFYNESYGGSTKQYNGNISAMSWKQSNESATLGYAFKYDNLSRLTQAAYLGNGSVYTNGYETAYSYDKHGNIKTLRRNGRTSASTYGTVDNLTMTYNGNQLQKVNDIVPNFAFAESADFKNYGGSGAMYTYNKNGAMVSDSHKGITKIQYNSLNLPYELLIKNTEVSGKVYYTYSASGVKLNTRHMKAKNLGYTPVTGPEGDTNLDIIKTTDYAGNMVYEDNVLKRILVDGGYIENNIYYFYVTDHLGNNRVVANQGGASVQRTHYYPFGMAFATGTTQEQGKQPYKYNGKELDQMHGLNLYDYSARYYEPAIGRFTTVDPLAEKYCSISPYAYVGNNPINAIDPDGRLIIFINGFHWGDGGSRDYWDKNGGGFASAVEKHLNDRNSIFLDGSLGGVKGLLGRSLGARGRGEDGYIYGKKQAEKIISSLKNGETIKLITHSMGAAYSKGFIKALVEYMLENNIDPSEIIEFEANFAPFQPTKLRAAAFVKTIQYSHNNDGVAGSKAISGAEYIDTSSDKDQEHEIETFYDQIKTLPTGKYNVVNGVIVPQK